MSSPAGQRRHPEYPLSIRHAVYSRSGSYVVNEHAAGNAIAQGFTLLAVAAGLGGHDVGEVACRHAEMEDTLRASASPDEWLARMADAIAGAGARRRTITPLSESSSARGKATASARTSSLTETPQADASSAVHSP